MARAHLHHLIFSIVETDGVGGLSEFLQDRLAGHSLQRLRRSQFEYIDQETTENRGCASMQCGAVVVEVLL